MQFAEYIWLDGHRPTQRLRSKTRIVQLNGAAATPDAFPDWGFDGSSTWQATGEDSDLTLQPVFVAPDPIRGAGHHLVLCEVTKPDGTPHETNQRARLRAVLDSGAAADEPWFGFEQEYTLYRGDRPLGWPESGYPAPQGPFYCGVGAGVAHGRELVETHLRACVQAGLLVYGINAEVMPGQWEFQLGYRGFDDESADPLTVADQIWIARWLLDKLGEDAGIRVSYANKPEKGDWNGAGSHTNFSTRRIRDPRSGADAIEDAIQRLEETHAEHIAVYGSGLAERLTGLHETCSIHEFRSGVANRGASIRIPRHVATKGYGYLEDRRPGANSDPYAVCARILETICLAEAARVAA
jgi:glutamine synthetase